MCLCKILTVAYCIPIITQVSIKCFTNIHVLNSHNDFFKGLLLHFSHADTEQLKSFVQPLQLMLETICIRSPKSVFFPAPLPILPHVYYFILISDIVS